MEADPARARVQVIFFGEVVADSRDAIRLDNIYYFLRRDVKMERLYRSSRRKGEASCFSLANGRLSEDAAWSFEESGDGIRGRLAFDPAKVDTIRILPDDK